MSDCSKPCNAICQKIAAYGLKEKIKGFLDFIAENPFQIAPL
jgi:hypothetical protein